jgi:hypothetical protein
MQQFFGMLLKPVDFSPSLTSSTLPVNRGSVIRRRYRGPQQQLCFLWRPPRLDQKCVSPFYVMSRGRFIVPRAFHRSGSS